MAGVPLSIGPDNASDRTRTVSSFQYIYDQIDILRRQTDSAMSRGAFDADTGGRIAGRLDMIEKAIDSGVADRSMSRSDLREVNAELHEIRKNIVLARRMAADAAVEDADSGRSGQRQPRILDISV